MSMHDSSSVAGLSLRQAALIAGFALLIMGGTPFAEFYAYARLVDLDDIPATVNNIAAQPDLFLAAFFGYFITFVGDIVVAWALYVLLAPVNRALSMLTAWFRLAYTLVALFALFKLVTVYRLIDAGQFSAVHGTETLNAHIEILIRGFRYEWSLGLVLFGVHLALLGYLCFRAGYIPRYIGVLLAIAGLGYVVMYLGPYLYPEVELGWLFATFFGELVFMLWLLLRGWRLPGGSRPVPG